MEERRKKVVLCGKLFNQIETLEGFDFDSAVKRINGCLAGLEKKKMDDISSQIINVFNGKNEQKKDILINLLESLNVKVYEELVYWICRKCSSEFREFSHGKCNCKIRVYGGLTVRELFEEIAKNYNLSFGEILEKSKGVSIIFEKENGILGELIHIFKCGIPSLDKIKVQ